MYGELAGRSEDEDAWIAFAFPFSGAGHELLIGGDQERGRFASARLRLARDVFSFQRDRQSVCLDRRAKFEACICDAGAYIVMQFE